MTPAKKITVTEEEFADLKPGDKLSQGPGAVTFTFLEWLEEGERARFSYPHLPNQSRRYAKGGVIFDRGEYATIELRVGYATAVLKKVQ